MSEMVSSRPRIEESIIDRTKLFKQLDYSPHGEEQWELHNDNSRYRVACCGRRWGKSTWAGNEMTLAMFVPDSTYWIVGPTYTLGEKEFRVVFHNLFTKLKLDHPKIRKSYNVRTGDMRIELGMWNTILEVKTAEKPDQSLVGEGLDGVIMSEAAKHKRETWERYIEPALSDKRGWADFPSTPEGFNFFHTLYEWGQTDQMKGYRSWKLPTWTNLAMYPGGENDPEIQRIKKTVSKQYFRQEYAADFTTFEGQIYEEFDPRWHIKDIAYNPVWRNYLIFDYGYADPFVALDIMVDPSDNVYVWREYYMRYMSTWEHGQYLKEREQPPGYHIDAMFGDPRGADEAATLALILGPVWGRPVGWSAGVEAVKRWLKLQPDGQPKLFIDKECANLRREMPKLRVKDAGSETKNAKEGQHDYDDHCCDTLRYFFNEWLINGAGNSLADTLGGTGMFGNDDTFFTLDRGFTLNDRI